MNSRQLTKIAAGTLISALLFSCADTETAARIDAKRITVPELNEVAARKARLLGVTSLSPEDRLDLLEQMIQREITAMEGLKMGIAVSPEAIAEAIAGMDPQPTEDALKAIEHNLLIDATRRTVTGAVKPTWDDLDAYYRANLDDFERPDLYKVYLIPGDIPDLVHVLPRVREKPDRFEEMALELVPGDVRAINRGAPYVPLDDFPDEVQSLLATMPIGGIEGPVTTERGSFIFKLEDKKPSHVQSFREAYDELRHLVTAVKKQEAFDRWYEDMRKQHTVTINEKNI